MNKSRDLILPVFREFFEQIKSGEKCFEYRLRTDYWTRRIVGKTFDRVVVTLGYPKRGDDARRIVRPWSGYEIQTIKHGHFGNIAKECFAIRVNPHEKSEVA